MIQLVFHSMKTVPELLAERDRWREDGNWIPACGGTEVPFQTRTGKRLQYVYQPRSGKHAYIDCGTDIVLSDDDARLALGIG